jgi:hypothetical protein
MMKSIHNLEPQMKHYGCTVNLVGRADQLEPALRFIIEMPVAPGPVVWKYCWERARHGDDVRRDVCIAEVVTKKLSDLTL